jgi:hypothetical protein
MPALGDAAGNIRFDVPKFLGQQWGKERSPIQMSLLWPGGKDWVAVSNRKLGDT